jgi:hypothetical protein
VLRNRATNDTYLVVLITLYLKEDINEDGSLKPAAIAATKEDRESKASEIRGTHDASADHGKGDYEEARKHFEKLGVEKSEGTGGGDDDVD